MSDWAFGLTLLAQHREDWLRKTKRKDQKRPRKDQLKAADVYKKTFNELCKGTNAPGAATKKTLEAIDEWLLEVAGEQYGGLSSGNKGSDEEEPQGDAYGATAFKALRANNPYLKMMEDGHSTEV